MTDTTPRPWEVITSMDDGEFYSITPSLRYNNDNGGRLEQMWQGSNGTQKWEVVPIVQGRTAVNAHEDLVKALEEMSADYDDMPRHDTGILERARSALAKAKGEKT